MSEELNYQLDTSIDEQALDVEWLQQADLMRKYASHAAATKRYMDELKERIDVEKARLDLEIRKDPAKYGIEKVTESVVQSAILVQPEYKDLQEKYREARYENDIANAAVRAIDQKKTALENLVRLLTANYFAGPATPRDLSKEWTDNVERRGNNARVRMRRRTKDQEE
jgi:hypothetical protein